MPRVTAEHSRARRQQILDAARTAFIRDGFHATSMQDIQREAGLSAGAIYLYFKSKDEIIAAIAADALATVSAAFDMRLPDRPPPDLDTLVGQLLSAAERLQNEKHIFPLVVQVWSEALRNPPLLAKLTALFDEVRGRLTHLLAESQASGQIDPHVDPGSLVMALLGLVQGYIVQSTLLEETTSFERYQAGVHALMRSGANPDDCAAGS